MIRYAYNTQLQPPAPFVLVTLRHPRSGVEQRDLPAELDSAADRTLVPSAIVQSLALDFTGSITIGGVGGTLSQVAVYLVQLGIHTFPPRLVEVVAHPDEPWVLLGRDVLNAYRVVLDGPGLFLEIN
jgi:hypothetical protein